MAAAPLIYWTEDAMSEMSWNQARGRALAEARDEKGWTQDQLAEKLGVHRRTIVKYESGEGNKADFFDDMAEALGLDAVGLALRARIKRKMSSIDPAKLEEELSAQLLNS